MNAWDVCVKYVAVSGYAQFAGQIVRTDYWGPWLSRPGRFIRSHLRQRIMSAERFAIRRMLLALFALALLAATGCCGGMHGCRRAISACDPCANCQPMGHECENCGDCCSLWRPQLGARLAGRFDALRAEAETPWPEPPPSTGLHSVPTSPVFGPRVGGRDAGILASAGVLLEGAEPAPLPIVVPPTSQAPPAKDHKPMQSAKNATGTEHLNRLPRQPIRRVSHTAISSGQADRSQLRFAR